MKSYSIFSLLLFFLCACSTTKEKPKTLHSVDISSEKSMQANVFVKPKTDEEIRQAYADYIKNTTKEDKSRLSAISRLAELELELSNELLKKQQTNEIDANDSDNSLYGATLDKTIDLLSTSLRDAPKAKGNDRILYQLAKAHDQKGNYLDSIETLKKLVKQYPKSPFYIETQFRLAEHAFATSDYISAEDAYTEVIVSPRNDIFYEKSLFKRGWSRYKQQLYLEAVDDYIEAANYHEFGDYNTLEKTEKDLFDEYFRAIGLAFSHLGSGNSLRDYFADDTNPEYSYYAYSSISDIYLKQERYSDAVATLSEFIQTHPNSKYIPGSRLKIIQMWQKSGFTNKLYKAIESFYTAYNPSNAYWKTTNTDNNINKTISKSLKQYVVLVSEYFHDQYQNSGKTQDFEKAKIWYERYLDHYSSYARQDNIFYLYAELLDRAKREKDAIYYFELAAYDDDIILDKKAAYATIVLSDHLYNNSQANEKGLWLDKHLKYVQLYSQLYPADKHTENIVVHAAELALSDRQYQQAITLAELIPSHSSEKSLYNIHIILGQAYFKLNQFADSEAIYTELLTAQKTNNKDRRKLRDQVALSIYKQGEQAKNNGDIKLSVQTFMRIADKAPHSAIASTGVYDAIALAISQEWWSESIAYIKTFQQLYPRHKLNNDVAKKLSLAYLKSNQDIKAAQEFERISNLESDRKLKKAALWQAAELYESKKDWRSAIRSYREYANTYNKPFPQYMESMYKLTQLYDKTGDVYKSFFWRNKIRTADRRGAKSAKTDRTRYIASMAILGLAKEKHDVYGRRKLVEPLKSNLRKKKKAMQEAVKLYGQASIYGIAEITTEATYTIGSIYQDFSIALLESERPKSLNIEELEQYEILLEDQAFPFEEKAIEFYETNLARVKDGTYNQWIKQCYTSLVELFPVRYKRKGKTEDLIDDIP